MKLFVVLLATAVALANGAAVGEVSNLYQFRKFISCLGDIGFFDTLDYVSYACYCGYGGQGKALDPTDRCCVEHDNCYGRAVTEAGCSSFNTYTTIYDYETTTDQSGNCAIKCKKESDYSLKTDAKCKAFMCECDRVGAQCFADERGSFNSNYVSYDKDSC